MAQATLREIPALIAARKDFKGNSMSATHQVFTGLWWAGRLTGDDLDRWNADGHNIEYAVYSYNTPIAWVLKDGSTYRVAQKFSVTTSKHQGKLYTL
jgi:hypothetical protein